MDSEGEEQTLKTCNSITGKNGFLKSACHHNTHSVAHTRVHACMFHLPLWVRGNRFNNPTLELSILWIILLVLKSTALSFHYSEGNNFIKLEHRLKLVKECVSVVWLKTSRLAMSLCKCSGGLWGPVCAHRRYYHIRERGEEKNHEKCYRYWLRLTREGAELVNEIPEGLVGGKLI